MTDTRSTTTLEYVRVEILEEQGLAIDADTVDLAFVADGSTPGVGDWHAGIWLTPPKWQRTAAILVGPGALELDPGTYTAWYRFQDAAERPVRPAAGQLVIVD